MNSDATNMLLYISVKIMFIFVVSYFHIEVGRYWTKGIPSLSWEHHINHLIEFTVILEVGFVILPEQRSHVCREQVSDIVKDLLYGNHGE